MVTQSSPLPSGLTDAITQLDITLVGLFCLEGTFYHHVGRSKPASTSPCPNSVRALMSTVSASHAFREDPVMDEWSIRLHRPHHVCNVRNTWHFT